MTLSSAEIDRLRFHLGYGNLAVGADLYTRDGFLALFEQVVSLYLNTGTETSATTVITAGAITEVTPAAMTDIAVYGQLIVDVGDDAEQVMVQAVTGSTFTARFAKAHAATGYPIATESGLARLRLLLWDADKAYRDMYSSDTAATSGIKQIDKGDVIFFGGSSVLKGRFDHYMGIVSAIASLVHVAPAWAGGNKCAMEAY